MNRKLMDLITICYRNYMKGISIKAELEEMQDMIPEEYWLGL